MTPQETLLLVRYVRACCPQQHLDEFSPDAWHDLLGDLDAGDCRDAVAAVAKRQPFVAPAEIRADVKRIREERLARTPLPAPPPEVTDEPGRYKRIVDANIRRIADARDIRPALKALPGPLPGDPPQEWQEARAAMVRPGPPAVDPRQKAREQVEESRARRGEIRRAADEEAAR